ncbi:MAG: uracil-DNA glycosylase family protein [Acidimicrobiales bacterium]
MDRATADIYERGAGVWAARRKPTRREAARAFATRARDRTTPDAVVADLGCGPGWYARELPGRVVVLDVASSMLSMAADHAPASWRVQGDLEALPFRTGVLAAAWAANSYVHVRRSAMPLALADLHRSLVVGAPVEIRLFAGSYEGHDLPGDDFPGRYFSMWPEAQLRDVVIGAGFEVDELESWGETGRHPGFAVRATRARTLPDYVAPGMRLLLCGLNPSVYAADAGVGFARPGNRFWPAARAAGIVSRDRDPRRAVAHHGIGMTDLVKRATPSASELRPTEYAIGMARVERLVSWLEPSALCFIGLTGWRAAADRRAHPGVQERQLGGRPVYVMPNTSGANAHARLPDFVAHLRAAVALAERGV